MVDLPASTRRRDPRCPNRHGPRDVGRVVEHPVPVVVPLDPLGPVGVSGGGVMRECPRDTEDRLH